MEDCAALERDQQSELSRHIHVLVTAVGGGMLIAYLIVTDRAVSRFSHSVRGSKPEWTCDCFSMLSIVKESYVSTQK